ncbi:MAG: hypothetical protein FWC76_02855 [Defluviitaleaceae bacterium]|nr:hypothetical protein [Defluviitaleaceae bacterium]
MEYCLCIKPDDNNLLHIISQDHMHKAAYATYKIVKTVFDEMDAFTEAAALVQMFCDAHGDADFSNFKAWLVGECL